MQTRIQAVHFLHSSQLFANSWVLFRLGVMITFRLKSSLLSVVSYEQIGCISFNIKKGFI